MQRDLNLLVIFFIKGNIIKALSPLNFFNSHTLKHTENEYHDNKKMFAFHPHGVFAFAC